MNAEAPTVGFEVPGLAALALRLLTCATLAATTRSAAWLALALLEAGWALGAP